MKLNYTAKAVLAEYQCPHLKMTTVILKKKEKKRQEWERVLREPR